MGEIDVLIVTALKLEFEAARDVALRRDARVGGVTSWRQCGQGSHTPYSTADYLFPTGDSLKVALARPTRMGELPAATIASSLVERLKPRCLAMCGVCAGNPSEVSLGDVIIAAFSYTYDEGRRNDKGSLEPDHQQFSLNEPWLRHAQDLTTDSLPSFCAASHEDSDMWLMSRLYEGEDPRKHAARKRYFPDGTWEGRIANLKSLGLIRQAKGGVQITAEGKKLVRSRIFDNVDTPKRLPFAIHVGPIASGSSVVKDKLTWEQLRNSGVRSILGIEMEAAAIGGVAKRLLVPEWIVVKGVMDYADNRKDDKYKDFAARASAEVLFKFLSGVSETLQSTAFPAARQSSLPLTSNRPASDHLLAALGLAFGVSSDLLTQVLVVLGQVAPQFELMLIKAAGTALRAHERAEAGRAIADEIERALGARLVRARNDYDKKKVAIVRPPKGVDLGSKRQFAAKIWNSGDEYLGELSGKLEFGLGVYKIYRVGKSFTPNDVSHYFGEVRSGKFGELGVYKFPNGSRFSGEWVDGRPSFGYREMPSGDYGYEVYFGSMASIEDDHGNRWIPHGEGIGISTKGSRVLFGHFRNGALASSGSYRSESIDL